MHQASPSAFSHNQDPMRTRALVESRSAVVPSGAPLRAIAWVAAWDSEAPRSIQNRIYIFRKKFNDINETVSPIKPSALH